MKLLIRLLVICALPTWSIAAPTTSPSIPEINTAALQTMEKLKTAPASWNIAISRPGDKIHLYVFQAPPMRTTRISGAGPGQRQEQPVVQIIDRDGFWYVTEGLKRGKYRPYEAPFAAAPVPIFLRMGQLSLAINTDPASFGAYEASAGTIASFRAPVSGAVRNQMKNWLVEINRFAGGDVKSLKPELQAQMETITDVLDRGVLQRIDTSNGMIMESGSPQFTVRNERFSWLENTPAEVFDVSGNWDDNTSDPTQRDINALAIICHAGTWQPGMPSGDVEARLVELDTGKFRRIPLIDRFCGSGCFSNDRQSVIVTGLDSTLGTMGLYEVNLKTRTNRQLGGKLLSGGYSFGPVLSPDGTQVAVMHKEGTEATLHWQLCIIDLKSDVSRPISEWMDAAFPSWSPDGNSLIFLVRDEHGDLKKPADSTISRIDLQGKITPLRRGNNPVVLRDGRILFIDQEDSMWKTCDLSGATVQLLGDGLKEYFSPTPAPDGKRLIMMKRAATGPIPEIIDLSTGKGQRIPLPGGLWGMPAWS